LKDDTTLAEVVAWALLAIGIAFVVFEALH
jgi:hypothetical protein